MAEKQIPAVLKKIKAKKKIVLGAAAAVVVVVLVMGLITCGGGDKVAAPTAEPKAGAVNSGTLITLTSATEDAKIFYTTDGSDPTSESTEYTRPITITEETTVRAIAYKEGLKDSAILTAKYSLRSTDNDNDNDNDNRGGDSSGVGTIFGYIGNTFGGVTVTYWTSNEGNIVIPDTIDGKPVTAFSDDLFRNVTSNSKLGKIEDLISVTLPDSIVQIPERAFEGCSGLSKIKLPANIVNIPNRAFYNCSKLKSIEIPVRVVSIGNSAFQNSGLETVTIANAVTTIGNSAFQNSKLTTVTIANAVTTIGNSAFQECDNLGTVTISGPVASIGQDAFNNCKDLEKITLPDSVASLGQRAFNGCWKLYVFNTPASLATFGAGVIFNRCHKIPLAERAKLAAQGYKGGGF